MGSSSHNLQNLEIKKVEDTAKYYKVILMRSYKQKTRTCLKCVTAYPQQPGDLFIYLLSNGRNGHEGQ